MKKLFVVTSFLLLQLLFQRDVHAQLGLADLQTEYTETPLGIDVTLPRFSWQMRAPADARGVAQRAFRIVVRDREENVVWDTGQVESDRSVHIVYAGRPLEPTTRYDWEVTIRGEDDTSAAASSWFETGLMNADPDRSAWDGATWIGGSEEDLVFYPHYLSVFKLRYTQQLDQATGSTRAGFVFGANDRRLMDPDLNVLGAASGEGESYIELEIDIARVDGTA